MGLSGGIHLNSVEDDPRALRRGEVRSTEAASCVLTYILLLTPQPPRKVTQGFSNLPSKEKCHIDIQEGNSDMKIIYLNTLHTYFSLVLWVTMGFDH